MFPSTSLNKNGAPNNEFDSYKLISKQGALVDQAEFSNEFLTTTFTQRKQWQGETQLGRPRIRLQLYRDGQTFGEGVYLPLQDGDAMWTTGSWEYTWENLPRLKADGSGPSVYHAVELVPPPNYQSWVQDGVIYNYYRPGTFSASKLWSPQDPVGTQVTFNLYQTILQPVVETPPENPEEPPAEPPVDPPAEPYKMLLDTVTLTGQKQADTTVNGEHEPWVYTWLNLPANGEVNGEYVSFEYTVEEQIIPDGYDIDTTASASRVVTNFLTETQATLTKAWQGGAERPPAQFKLFRDGALYGTITLPLNDGDPMWETDTWTYTWTKLPKFKESAKVMDPETGLMVWDFANWDIWEQSVYTVEEMPVQGYEAQVSGMQITNHYLASIGDYVWYDKNGNGIQDEDNEPVANVRVIIEAGEGTTLPDGYDPVRYTDENGLYLFEHLPPGNYIITFDPATFPDNHVITKVRSEGSTEANDSNSISTLVPLQREDILTIDLGLVFVPPATPAPDYAAISVPLYAEKILRGRQLAEGEFTFVLKDAAGNIVNEKTNAKDGSVVFDARRFSRPGTFLYTLYEKAGASRDIKYDSTVYRITIRVWEDGGKLKHSLHVDKNGAPFDGALQFTNAYLLPPTGDAGLTLPLTLLALALLGLLAATKRRQLRQ